MKSPFFLKVVETPFPPVLIKYRDPYCAYRVFNVGGKGRVRGRANNWGEKARGI